jgi:hypothetical protein
MMSIDENRDTSKLPKWAQSLIVDLKRERDHVIKEQAESLDAQTPSLLWYDERHLGADSHRYIQAKAVTFLVGGNEISVNLIQRSGQPQPGLEINGGFFGRLVVLPESSNSITVRMARWPFGSASGGSANEADICAG